MHSAMRGGRSKTMARLDPSRSAVEVDELELTVAHLLLTDPTDKLLDTTESKTVRVELERAGIVEDGAVTGYPARLLSVVLQPELRLMLERFAAETPIRDFAAVSGSIGVWGEGRSGGATEFTPIEPELIPWAVARAVGLGPRKLSAVSGPIEFRAATLEDALTCAAQGDIEGAANVLATDDGLPSEKRDALLHVLLQRRLSWRAVSVWTGSNGEKAAAGVAAIDGGDAGLWLSSRSDDSAEATVRLQSVESSVVWDRIVALVPFPVADFDGA